MTKSLGQIAMEASGGYDSPQYTRMWQKVGEAVATAVREQIAKKWDGMFLERERNDFINIGAAIRKQGQEP